MRKIIEKLTVINRYMRVTWTSVCIAVVFYMPAAAWATNVVLGGLSSGRAVIVVDGSKAKTLKVGMEYRGIKLLKIENGAALFMIDGKKRRLTMGQGVAAMGSRGGDEKKIILKADSRGHFFTTVSINGIMQKVLVDTGATMVALSPSQASRARIDFRGKGTPGWANTANGRARSWMVGGNSVKLGNVTLNNIPISVTQAEMPFGLLGMSVLNRFEMKRNGNTMVLKQRY